jgi:hypothetical protein
MPLVPSNNPLPQFTVKRRTHDRFVEKPTEKKVDTATSRQQASDLVRLDVYRLRTQGGIHNLVCHVIYSAAGVQLEEIYPL